MKKNMNELYNAPKKSMWGKVWNTVKGLGDDYVAFNKRRGESFNKLFEPSSKPKPSKPPVAPNLGQKPSEMETETDWPKEIAAGLVGSAIGGLPGALAGVAFADTFLRKKKNRNK